MIKIVFILIGLIFSGVYSMYADNADEYIDRGITSAQQGNYDQAVSDFTKAIEVDTNNPDAYTNRGSIYIDQVNFIRAISDFTRALEIDITNAYAFYG